MIKTGLAILGLAAVIGLAQTGSSGMYAGDGKLKLPTGYRRWVFLGSPLTPNGLNNGKAGFPEFHNVYVQTAHYDSYVKNGKFPEGTVLVKELVTTLRADHPDGSANEASGRGYFQGDFAGLDVMVKDTKKYAATGGWGFFNFGHKAPPYEPAAEAQSKAQCAGCHQASAGRTDMVFTRFYPMLSHAK